MHIVRLPVRISDANSKLLQWALYHRNNIFKSVNVTWWYIVLAPCHGPRLIILHNILIIKRAICSVSSCGSDESIFIIMVVRRQCVVSRSRRQRGIPCTWYTYILHTYIPYYAVVCVLKWRPCARRGLFHPWTWIICTNYTRINRIYHIRGTSWALFLGTHTPTWTRILLGLVGLVVCGAGKNTFSWTCTMYIRNTRVTYYMRLFTGWAAACVAAVFLR